MGGSKRSLSALRHALQLLKACLNKRHRGWDKISFARRLWFTSVFCIMLDSNMRGNSAPYILGLTSQITLCSPRPDAAATRVQSDLRPSPTGCRR